MEHSLYTKKTAIIFFADIIDFTKYSLEHSLEENLEVLETVMEIALMSIYQRDYEILEFTGDEVMAALENPETAFSFIFNFKTHMDEILQKYGLFMRYGAHIGEVVVIATKNGPTAVRKIIGAEVNRTKKIQEASNGEILVSDLLAEKLRNSDLNKKIRMKDSDTIYNMPTFKVQII